MALKIETMKSDFKTTRVKLAGMLDTETSEQFDHIMLDILADPDVRNIRLELNDLTYISSLGLGSIAKIKKAIAAKGGIVITIGAQPQIARVFDIVKMLPKETIFATREEADDYLAAIQKNVLEEAHPIKPAPA